MKSKKYLPYLIGALVLVGIGIAVYFALKPEKMVRQLAVIPAKQAGTIRKAIAPSTTPVANTGTGFAQQQPVGENASTGESNNQDI